MLESAILCFFARRVFFGSCLWNLTYRCLTLICWISGYIWELLNYPVSQNLGFCCSVMVQDYRRLSKDLRQSEAEIEKLLAKHADKGFSSPVRRDGSRKNLSLSTRHGRVFDTNIESVNRKDKVKKVGDKSVSGFTLTLLTLTFLFTFSLCI